MNIKFNGIQFDSEEERLFYLYLHELKENNWIKDFRYHVDSFLLSDVVKYEWKKYLKTKAVKKESTLLQPHYYTPDFQITWNPIAYRVFYLDINDGYKKLDTVPFINNIDKCGLDVGSYIEIKPSFDFKNMSRLAIINQKWMYAEHNIYVQKIIPISKTKCLFRDTFVPQKAMYTKTGKIKKYHFPTKTLNEFVKEIENAKN